MGTGASLADTITGTDFESGTTVGWEKGTQTGNLNNTITGNGTGVSVINGAVTFSAPAHGAVGSPTKQDGSPNPYYQPAVSPTTWTFSPYGSYGAALQPTGSTTFDAATSALGLTSAENQAIKTKLQQDQQASGLGNPNPTNAAWITQNVTLNAGTTYTMSWNYIGTDYVPFNDGSITSLVYQGTGSTPVVTVNNYVQNYALLGFTNPGTGDYSTGTYGSTGWQSSTYQVDITGAYLLGFAVFNLGDTALSPVLLVDSQPGTTLKNGQTFGAVTPNNPNAPNNSTLSAPTVTGTSTSDQVASSSSTSNVVVTAQVTYNVSNLDGNGYGTVQNYTDTVETTTPVTTVTTTTTPVTTTTYSDGSTTTSNGTSVVTSSSSNGSSSSEVTGTALNYTSTIAPSISNSTAQSNTLPQTYKNDYTFTPSEGNGKQNINVHLATEVTTPLVTTVTTTPVTTTVYADGTTTTTDGTPVVTYVNSENVSVVDTYKDYSGRIDQYDTLDKVNNSINGLLDHEPSKTKEKFRVFSNNHYIYSYSDGYTASSTAFGGGFEYDVKPTWTVGAQYNKINIDLLGTDSISSQKKDHFGFFNALYSKWTTLNTNFGYAKNTYKVGRTVEYVFYNQSEPKGNEWWLHNRLYVHPTTGVAPYVGYTVGQLRRDGYTEIGSIQSTRTVDALNQTTHIGEVGLKLEHRFGKFGVSVDGSYATDSVMSASASVDYNQVIFFEGNYDTDGTVSNASGAVKVKFRF
jgi:hypothetical protein